jgi:Protein of unknown function (DUF4240)
MEKTISWQSLITEQKFWDIIQLSLIDAKTSFDKQIENLNKIFKSESDEELIGFKYYTVELRRKAYTANLWAAAELVMQGCSDDSFYYFRYWLVSRGQEVFYNALENPDSLLNELRKYRNKPNFDIEPLNIVVSEFYQNTYNRDLSDIIEEKYTEDFIYPYEEDSDIDLFWQNDINVLQRTCPLLFEQYFNIQS